MPILWIISELLVISNLNGKDTSTAVTKSVLKLLDVFFRISSTITFSARPGTTTEEIICDNVLRTKSEQKKTDEPIPNV